MQLLIAGQVLAEEKTFQIFKVDDWCGFSGTHQQFVVKAVLVKQSLEPVGEKLELGVRVSRPALVRRVE